MSDNQQAWLSVVEDTASLRLKKLVPADVIPTRVQEIRNLVLGIIEKHKDEADAGNILRIVAAMIPLSKRKGLMEDDNLMNAVAQKIEEIKLRKRVKKLLEEEEQSEDPLENILED